LRLPVQGLREKLRPELWRHRLGKALVLLVDIRRDDVAELAEVVHGGGDDVPVRNRLRRRRNEVLDARRQDVFLVAKLRVERGDLVTAQNEVPRERGENIQDDIL